MISLGTLFSGINTADRISGRILGKKGTRLEKKIEAVEKLQLAINATTSYLVSSKNNYVPNFEISQLWVKAFSSMLPFDKDLAKKLRQKSVFWSDPQSWLNEPGSMELVPKLKDLNERCEEMINTLELRVLKR